MADEHGRVSLHDGRRQGLEMTPEVAQSHVLRIAWEKPEGETRRAPQCNHPKVPISLRELIQFQELVVRHLSGDLNPMILYIALYSC